MNAKRPVLEVDHLTLSLKKKDLVVVDDVSFKIEQGEMVALLGESGAGKSTLFKAVLQVLQNSDWNRTGSITTEGREITGKTPEELEAIRGPQVRCLFQEPALSLNPSLKIDRQMKEAILAVQPGLTKEEVDERIETTLIDSGLQPEVVMGKYPGDLSGGQRQRVGAAMSLCAPSPLLLADEPSNSLDSVTVTELVKTMLKLKESGYIGSIFIVTHDLGVLKAMDCPRVLFMDQGKVYEAGSIHDVLEKPAHPKLAEMVGLMNVIDSMETHPHISQGRDPLFEAKDIQFGYKRRSFFNRNKIQALWDVNFTVGKNEFVALVGNSGSGKSTIGKLLTRENWDFEGSLNFDGEPIESFNSKQGKARFHREVQVIFQEPADTFDPALTMRENLTECFTAMDIPEESIEGIFDELLDTLLLDRRMLESLPKNLSGGQKQRFALMRAFGTHPSMILADEPFNNLDLISQQRLIELLLERKTHKDKPMSCVLISHDIGVVSKLCDKVLVVDQGRIVEAGAVEDIVSNPTHEATKRLINAAEMLGSIQL